MDSGPLGRLLAGNDVHVSSLPTDHFADVQEAQQPWVVSVCCSDSRVSQEGMFGVADPGQLFTASNIGNQAWDVVERDRVVDGSLLYPLVHTDTRTVAVVGHTGCGAVTATYRQVTGDAGPEPPGIQKMVEGLRPVVESGLEAGVGDAATESRAVDELVEYNVDRQVAFLRESDEVPEGTSVFGFVYDFHDTYGVPRGTTVLVNADGTRDPAALQSLPGADADHVGRLVEP